MELKYQRRSHLGRVRDIKRVDADEQLPKALISGLHRIMELLYCTNTSFCHVMSCRVVIFIIQR